MDRARYDALTAALADRLSADDRVVGLVALGSMAAQDYQPDRWSDHDFYVVVEDAHAEPMRQDHSWLPEPERIVFALRETEHGVKVVYDDAHLMEYAVFTRAELAATSAGRWRVHLDRGGITDTMASIARGAPAGGAVDVRYELGMMATNLLVGVGRHERGEVLSGHVFVTAHALGHLLRALSVRPSAQRDRLDALDPRRRFEQAYPTVAVDLHRLLHEPVPSAARAMLQLARRELAGDLTDDVERLFDVVTAAFAS